MTETDTETDSFSYFPSRLQITLFNIWNTSHFIEHKDEIRDEEHQHHTWRK